ncbi:histone deacetylase complex subunit SAP18 [Galendromus occidentalis]|uniref:18 kDa Sin3-associated polypeptide n=1 Tax=Galendromus occidentalis TaxID=34638 RepID=A0AAJ6QR89_9ACAR|nr:histone deacetylase complex subunit SAP18 [Galendromus occidentalis]
MEAVKFNADKPVDREKTCPLLLRVFLSNVRHHSTTDYSRGQVPSNELQVYTWMDASLRELTGLIKEVNREARKKGTVFDFALVYPDRNSAMYRFREIGSTVSGQKGPDDTKTLRDFRFTIGDYLDIAITPPRSGGNPRY